MERHLLMSSKERRRKSVFEDVAADRVVPHDAVEAELGRKWVLGNAG